MIQSFNSKPNYCYFVLWLLFCSLTISINVLKCIIWNENFDFVIFNLHYLKISTFPIIFNNTNLVEKFELEACEFLV